jgi:aspartate kinase
MLMASGFLRTLFDVFARHETSVDMVATSEISVSVTVDDASRLPEIRREIEELASVEVAGHRAIVCLVGQDLKFTAGLAGRVFRAVERINILMISQGASRRNISFVLEERDVEDTVRSCIESSSSEVLVLVPFKGRRTGAGLRAVTES